MRSVRPWIILCLLAAHIAIADEALEKELADAAKLSTSRDTKSYTAGDAKFAEIRERKDLSAVDRARTWFLQGRSATTRRDFPLANIALKKAISTLPDTAPGKLRGEFHRHLASVYYNQARYEAAAAETLLSLKAYPADANAIELHARALEILGQHREAVKAMSGFIKSNPGLTPSQIAAVEGHRLRTLSGLKDWPAVVAGVDTFLVTIKDHMNVPDVRVRVAETRRLKVQAQLAAQDVKPALESARIAVETFYADSSSMATVILDSESPEAIRGYIEILRDLQIDGWKVRGVYDHTQVQVSRLLLALGDTDAALWEARSLYLNCSPNLLATGAMQVASCLKAKDGNLIRANQFLRFVRFGPAGEDEKSGTADDLVDPTIGLKPVGSKTYVTAIQTLIDTADDGWQTQLNVARLHVSKGDLQSALASYQEAFAKSPGNQRDTQLAANALADFVGRLSRDEPLVKDVMAFLMFGPNGPDTKAKTADDIADPATRLAALLTPTKND